MNYVLILKWCLFSTTLLNCNLLNCN